MPARQTTASSLVPEGTDNAEVRAGGKLVRLTNLRKPFWPELGITKGDLLRYYAAVSTALLPHIKSRAMVMKRYPHGAAGEFFFMKRTPSPRPEWLQTCTIEHDSGNVIDFPLIQDLAALLWVVNLGCIDLNQWYARCDDVDRPDYFHFDLDPGPGATFEQVCEAALLLHDALETLKMPSFAKTSGSKGIHIYVPIKRGPTQKDVWTVHEGAGDDLGRTLPDTPDSVISRRKRRTGACWSTTTRTPGGERWRACTLSGDKDRQRVDTRRVARNRARDHVRAIHNGYCAEACRAKR